MSCIHFLSIEEVKGQCSRDRSSTKFIGHRGLGAVIIEQRILACTHTCAQREEGFCERRGSGRVEPAHSDEYQEEWTPRLLELPCNYLHDIKVVICSVFRSHGVKERRNLSNSKALCREINSWRREAEA